MDKDGLRRQLEDLEEAAERWRRPVPKDNAPETDLKVLDLEGQLRDSLAKRYSERQQLFGQLIRSRKNGD